MPIPSALHRTTYEFDTQPDGEPFEAYLSRRARCIILNEEAPDIPPLLSEVLPQGTSLTNRMDPEVVSAIGSSVFVLGLVLGCIKVKRSITSYIIAVCPHTSFSTAPVLTRRYVQCLRHCLECKETLDVLGVRWGYPLGGHQLHREIGRAAVNPRNTFEGVAIAVGIMLDPILSKLIGAIAAISTVSSR